MGGGGLDVYGALHCGKIYTVFFPMPGKGWTLQYCRSGAPEAKAGVADRANVIHLEQALLPPDAEAKFDFKRLPVPLDKKLKMIVLKGSITEDGTVANLQIYQSIVPQMDEAARAAFSRWKFKPALRGGRPVAVEILVGIPPEVPPSSAAR
jgi:TonB family protein